MSEFVLTPAERALLQALDELRVRCLLVGMGAALIEGAHGTTQDLDLWFERIDPASVGEAARRAGGFYTSGLGLQPPSIGGEGLDRVDIVLSADGLESFEDEYARAHEYDLDDVRVRVLPLERVIVSKRAANRVKDLAQIPLLEAALRRGATRRAGSSQPSRGRSGSTADRPGRAPLLQCPRARKPMPERFTLGIEEEFQIIDPATRELKSHIELMLAAGAHLGDKIKPELHQSVVEVGTPICESIREARAAVKSLRRSLVAMAEDSGARIVAAGTHPISHWKDQEITNRIRYTDIVNEMEDLARANLIFGLHVHVGVEDNEMRIQIMNGVRAFLPHLLALSVNSPFWCGRKTGVKSVRSTIFKRFPRTQIPDYYYSWDDYAKFVELLVRTGCIDDGKKIWWDVRPHAYFKTLEFRICDIPCRAEETVAIAAFTQALVAKLHRLYESNLGIRLYQRAVIAENKFRALKKGLDGKMIDFGLKREAPTRELILEALDFVDDVVDGLGTREEMRFLKAWAAGGDTGADRQVCVFEATGDLRAVVDLLVDETKRDL